MNKTILSLAVVLLTLLATACRDPGDRATETDLDGTWITSEHDNEDGIDMTFSETLELDASTHKFSSEWKIYAQGMKMGEVEIEGKWHADKKWLTLDFSKKDIRFHGLSDIMDKSELKDLKNDIAREYGRLRIESIEENTFVVTDSEGDESTYMRFRN